MATEAQIAANRANAQKSTGPRTEEGRNVVRFNAVKHGMCAEATVLPGEDAEAFERLRADVVAQLRPDGEMQAQMAERAARELWRLRRARVAETGSLRLLASPYAIQAEQQEAKAEDRELFAVSQALAQDFRDDGFLEKLSRWEGRCARALERCVRLLKLLQKGASAEKSPSPSPGSTQSDAPHPRQKRGHSSFPSQRECSRTGASAEKMNVPFSGAPRERDFPQSFADIGFVPPPFPGGRAAALGGVSQLALAVSRLMRTPEIQWPDGLRPA